ncbi:U3 small nucleolar RNA-associated protein 14 homolog A [Pectinophora gossypiella]|nr:U3 small nucleolar RNA-associated protein 14 homolog A [Pectinophora gossypiella]XP_049878649.1 U3 small nucleolar RNA-associated protein 14 homolog A [Pectinophora gossypiella]XP_049878651.1 U3 small nucleolar RNA-associated protein 14 homolog A [Pectinophora gossypiella]
MEDTEDIDYVASEHDRLVSAISKLDKTQHITEPTRNEPTNVNSEFDLIKKSNKLDLNKVVKVLGGTAHHVQIGKKLKKTQDASKVLPKPLEKPQAERIKRATGYEQTKKKVGRWDAVVARARTVDFVSFPIKHVSHKLQPTEEFLSKLTLKSPLEKALEEVDPPPVQEVEDEEEQLYPMTYQEMVEHRQQLAKMRAQQSYKAAKAKRQSKIKSKKYHRILKKEKLKNQLKEFEELQKKDPEEALKKLEALEKNRALERHTLRHKNTGKWAKSKLVRAKYDKDVRQELAEQLALSRGLTQKTQTAESSDDDADNNDVIPNIALDPMNPWMLKRSEDVKENNWNIRKTQVHNIESSDTEADSNIDEPVAKKTKNIPEQVVSKPIKEQKNKLPSKQKPKTKKAVATSNWTVEPVGDQPKQNDDLKSSEKVSTAFETYENKIANLVEKKLKKIRKNIERLENRSKSSGTDPQSRDEHEIDNLEYLKMKKKKITPIIDEELIETTSKNAPENNKDPQFKVSNVVNTADTQGKTDTNIDPSRFIEVKPKYLKTAIPEGENEYDQIDDEEQVVPKVNIEEVFEEDDVVASFRQEKEDEINKDKPQDIDLSLPGWGSWGGKGVKPPKRKKSRFILKAPPVMPRRDENKGDIIIKEYRDSKLASHKVTEVPFPFTSVKDYEASIRAPLGNTFIPEKAHKKLIRPNVITKAGTIIEPMDEEELLVPRNRKFKNESVIKLLGQKS